jgi:hypothetical protein
MKKSGAFVMLAFALSACAPPRPEEREVGVRHQDLSGDVEWRFQVQSSLVTHHVDAPVEQVWAVLPGIYEELTIPLSEFDAEQKMLGNREFVPKTIGGERMSRYLACGGPSSGRPFADAYQVEMFLITRVDGVGPEKTRIRTELFATARARDVGTNRVQCSTKGTLERRITEMITEKVGG